MPRERTAAFAGTAAVIAYYLWYAAAGMHAHFSPDDMQNLHVYWSAGWSSSAEAIVRFWSSFYRPLGSIFYLPLYEAAHLNIAPYRAAALALVIINSALVWKLLRLLTRDVWLTWVALAVWQFHLALFLVYGSNAIIYDILCLMFYVSGLTLYMSARLRGSWLSLGRLLGVATCYILALDAKEMAVTFPAALALLELIVLRPAADSWRTALPKLVPAVFMGVLTMIYLAGKLWGSDSLIGESAYRPSISWADWSRALAWYTSQLIYLEAAPVSRGSALALWALMIGLAELVRSRLALFGVAFAAVALLPVSFIELRQGFVWYLPLLGVAVWVACVMEPLFRRIGLLRWAVPTAIALTLFPPGAVTREHTGLLGAQAITWNFLEQIRSTGLQLPRGASVLVKDEPFGGNWDVYFILRLYFDDPSLRVAFSSPGGERVQGDVRDNYDVVLRVENGRLLRQVAERTK